MQSICLPQKRTHEQKRGKEGRNEVKGQKEDSTSPRLPISNPGVPVGTEYICSPALCHMWGWQMGPHIWNSSLWFWSWFSICHMTLCYAGCGPAQDHPEKHRVSASPAHCQQKAWKANDSRGSCGKGVTSQCGFLGEANLILPQELIFVNW